MAVTVSGTAIGSTVQSTLANQQSEQTINVEKVANEMLPALKNQIWMLKGVNPLYTRLAKTHVLGRQDPRAGDELHLRVPRQVFSFEDVYDLSGNVTAAQARANPHLTEGTKWTDINKFDEHIMRLKLDKHQGSTLSWEELEEVFNVNPKDWYSPIATEMGNRINSRFTNYLLENATSLTTEATENIGLDKFALARAVARMEDEGDVSSGEWVCAIRPSDCAALNDSLITIPNLPSAQVQKRISAPYAGQIGGVDIMKTHDLPVHRTGKFAGTLTTNTSATLSRTDENIEQWTVKIKGFASKATTDVLLRKGDKFGIEGVYSFNRGTRSSTGNLQVFTVLEDVSGSGASGGADAIVYDVKVKPGVLNRRTDPYRTHTGGGVGGADSNTVGGGLKVYMDGMPDSDYGQVLIYQTTFVAFIPVPMPKIMGGPDNAMARTPNSIALHVTTIGDGLGYNTAVRFDTHWGWQAFTTGYNKIHVIRFRSGDTPQTSKVASNVHQAAAEGATGGLIPTTGRVKRVFDGQA